MQKLYVITATFNAQNCRFVLYWLPSAHCFTFAEPRSIIPASDLHCTLSEAEAHARAALGVYGTKVPFSLRAEEVNLMGVRVMAGAPAGEWVSA